jgi:hypothetical protein
MVRIASHPNAREWRSCVIARQRCSLQPLPNAGSNFVSTAYLLHIRSGLFAVYLPIHLYSSRAVDMMIQMFSVQIQELTTAGSLGDARKGGRRPSDHRMSQI